MSTKSVFTNLSDKIAIDLTSKDTASSSSVNLVQLGLESFLLGFAVESVPRVSKISALIDKLEEKIFSEDMLAKMDDPAQLLEFFRISSYTRTQYLEFIKNALKSSDWGKLETAMLQYKLESTQKEFNDDSDIEKIARDVLKKMEQLKGTP